MTVFTHLPRGQEAVDTAAAAQIEDRFALAQTGNADRVATAERGVTISSG
jgi:hypothetical protein